jgi:hypothetical protein
MKTVFDASFKYTSSLQTDVRKTFDRIRREQRAKNAARTAASPAEPQVKYRAVAQLKAGG